MLEPVLWLFYVFPKVFNSSSWHSGSCRRKTLLQEEKYLHSKIKIRCLLYLSIIFIIFCDTLTSTGIQHRFLTTALSMCLVLIPQDLVGSLLIGGFKIITLSYGNLCWISVDVSVTQKIITLSYGNLWTCMVTYAESQLNDMFSSNLTKHPSNTVLLPNFVVRKLQRTLFCIK
jgi:hypothetical protein